MTSTGIDMGEKGSPMLVTFQDTTINEKFKDKIIERIKANDGYCPCVKERVKATLCPCNEYLHTHNCHCSLYIKKI